MWFYKNLFYQILSQLKTNYNTLWTSGSENKKTCRSKNKKAQPEIISQFWDASKNITLFQWSPWPLFSLYTPWKHWGMKWEHWPEIGWPFNNQCSHYMMETLVAKRLRLLRGIHYVVMASEEKTCLDKHSSLRMKTRWIIHF